MDRRVLCKVLHLLIMPRNENSDNKIEKTHAARESKTKGKGKGQRQRQKAKTRSKGQGQRTKAKTEGKDKALSSSKAIYTDLLFFKA